MEMHKCIQEERVRNLETGQAEMRIYIRDIREDIQEIKTSVKEFRPTIISSNIETSKLWSPIVVEMIKLVALCVTILGSIVGAVKILGR